MNFCSFMYQQLITMAKTFNIVHLRCIILKNYTDIFKVNISLTFLLCSSPVNTLRVRFCLKTGQNDSGWKGIWKTAAGRRYLQSKINSGCVVQWIE